MTKNEFMDGLRTSLTGELPATEVENNIKFYDDYISTKSVDNKEEAIMEQLGNPRLIAKTIVEAYQISHGPMYKSTRHEGAYQDVHTTDDDNTYQDQQSSYSGGFHNDRKNYGFKTNTQLKWYHKLLLIIVAIIVTALFVFIGGILFQLFIRIGFPLLFIYFVYKMVKNSMRR